LKNDPDEKIQQYVFDHCFSCKDFYFNKKEPETFVKIEKIYMQKHIELWDICRKFIDENKIESPELLYEMDSGDILAFIEQICELMGYYEEWRYGSE
jgi:hypothetical protein